ncbi:hypothetical protein RFN25_25345 [Mesorhizobium abyssinicae]|nr:MULTISPECIES: hypothetical protein [Mesorhizobium]RVC54426.1 hypothetical protein EN779_26860 [Mesorhizobium sp. M4B.F.Ca.ET.088.02.2.1]MDX8436753.1 hypothetical protein [Mesorhizobium abyssinicae]RWC97623.1 MAG: hypothetical protein EOS32_03705 [Mesorhizobium sp.]RWF33545.1 MAG: hypothetical protein EOS45_03155 [Mesorhizobium sp.]RWF43859.1 MAG: hypothetical protein EOS65_04095 [Mesorhizobium sp.]
MNLKAICLGAFALSVLGGVAFAGALDEPSNMQPFFTDSGMKTMKSSADFETAWTATPKSTQNAMMKECNDAAMSKPHAQFCAQLFALGHHS